jgi:hypothetical protein
MNEKKPCSLCQTECPVLSQIDNINNTGKQPVHWTECPACGSYIITEEAKHYLQNRKGSLHIISGITRNYYEMNDLQFIITDSMIEDDLEFETKILSQEPKTVLRKSELLSQYVAHKSNYPGDVVKIIPKQDYPICFCKNAKELIFYINHIRDIGDITAVGTASDYNLSLTAEGWQKIESMARPNPESKQAFVAMWFDQGMDEIFKNGISAIQEDTGFTMFRVDKTHFINEKICDKIIAEIKKSRFLICDVTGQRQAVYFEAGYAMGMALPVIWTCKESEVNACCFDTRQYPHIIWKDAEDLRNQLKEKILATIGKTRN